MVLKTITGILIVVLGLTIYFGVFRRTGEQSSQSATSTVVQSDTATGEKITISNAKRPNLNGPEGWIPYWNDELGVGFMYPPNWDISTSSPPRMRLVGDGYEIIIHAAGTGLPKKQWTHPSYIVGGEIAKTWQAPADIGDGHQQIIVARDVQFWIWTSDIAKKLSDELLSTVVFYKSNEPI